ncbi:hypothetical protein [Saccharopolyspora sp.]|uniref:hypothetical protein n=1 Tax=Saccharopolyspora sp. TaxID=33915 RepID=UPI0025EE6B6C|nr:hypothetical protein [Saccharopolyspora sp.]
MGWQPRNRPDDRDAAVPLISPLGPRHTLFEALDQMLSVNSSASVVVDEQGRSRGVLRLDSIRELSNVQLPGRPDLLEVSS